MGDIAEIRQKQKEVLDKLRKSAAIQRNASATLKLGFRCSSSKKDFEVLLERNYPGQGYRIVEINKDQRVPNLESNSLATEEITDININEMEDVIIGCPYCKGGKWSFIECECGKLSCAGGVEEYDGEYLHCCPWCGNRGYIGRDIEKVSGKMIDRKQISTNDTKKSLLPPARGMLDQGGK